MKKMILFMCLAFCGVFLAQSKMYIHKSDNVTLGVPLSSVSWKSYNDSLVISSGGVQTSFPVSQIDSVSFAEDSDTIRINFTGNSVSITNPLAFENVSVTATGANVLISSTSTTQNLNYKISGTTTNGALKIYSSVKYNLILDNANITAQSGPAINNQSGKKLSLILVDGATNTLTDGSSYSDTYVNDSGVTEDQNAAFFSKGDIIFSGTGSLIINGIGADKHALYSKDAITFASATLIIKSAAKDGIHPKDGITVQSGTINVTASGDAIDADEGFVSITGGSVTTNTTVASSDGIQSLTTMDISNAEINVTVAGDKSKGLNAGQNMTLGSGNITVNASGNAVLESSGSGYDPSYCAAIKCDSSITITGTNIIIKSTGKGGKGITADKNIQFNSGTINITASGAGATYKNSTGVLDSYHSTCITADGNISILGGTITTSSSGAGGRGITSDGTLYVGNSANPPNINITTTGSSIYLSGSGDNAEYDEAKTISCDGAITIDNGVFNISSADDGIKSDVSITINNGSITISKAYEGIEAPYITINNGTVSVATSDDGINTSKGNGGESNDGSIMTINGGTVSVNTTKGDGLDSNGSIVMTGGTVIVNGPPSAPEVAIDYNGTFNISGGLLIASGPNSGNMIQATSASSSQYSIKATANSSVSASTIFNIQDASSNSLVTFKPVRSVYYFVFSSPDIKSGSTYNIYTGGTSTGTNTNGLYVGGAYSGGTLKKSFSITGKVTSVTF
jgi:trimeric autotransporter adhesin